MDQQAIALKRHGGLQRLVRSFGHSYRGFRHALLYESAIRQELVALMVLVPAAILLPVSRLEHLILVLSMMLVVLLELVNSALEAAVDRISTEVHPLAGRAKDLASAAVVVAVLMSGLCWVTIAGPVLIAWVR